MERVTAVWSTFVRALYIWYFRIVIKTTNSFLEKMKFFSLTKVKPKRKETEIRRAVTCTAQAVRMRLWIGWIFTRCGVIARDVETCVANRYLSNLIRNVLLLLLKSMIWVVRTQLELSYCTPWLVRTTSRVARVAETCKIETQKTRVFSGHFSKNIVYLVNSIGFRTVVPCNRLRDV